MLSYEDALEHLLAATPVLAAVDVALAEAAGRVLADNVRARLTQPPFPAAAMDGYAIRFADLPGPWRVVGDSVAGRGFDGRTEAGEAVRIFTGAPMPDGADTVLVQEDTQRAGDRLTLAGDGPPAKGAHIRGAGQDFAAGDVLIAAATPVSARHVGLAAAAGHAVLRVRRRPRVALIATGSELVPPGIVPAAGQIVSSNGVMLAALFDAAGADVIDLGILPDDLGAITATIAATDCDLLVTIGGASVGDHDLVQPALRAAGAAIDFWKVAIKPGKPLIAGSLGNARVLGLPGNPVSAYVCALLFALPMLRRMAGLPAVPEPAMAPLLAPLPANGNRRDHLRARLGDDGVRPFPVQDSAMLRVLAEANALIVRPAGAAAARVGECVPVLTLDRIGLVP
jgi:molybdopterin molybdotransferase